MAALTYSAAERSESRAGEPSATNTFWMSTTSNPSFIRASSPEIARRATRPPCYDAGATAKEVAVIAFFGMGLLGSNFVRALRRRGEEVRVWNRSAGKARAL